MSLTRSLIIICIALGVSACHMTRTKTQPVLAGGKKAQEANLKPFNGLSVVGPFDVDIRLIPKQYYMHNFGNSTLVGLTNYFIKDGVLHVVTDQSNAYNPEIRMMLTVEVPSLDKLHYHGPGKVSLEDIDSEHFIVNGEGDGFIYLTGRATRFDATLSGNSRLDAKCLLARTIFVNTVDMAQAEVANNGTVSALSADNSDIYYYENPKMVAPYENQSGSVLRMTGIADPRPPAPAPGPTMQASVDMRPAEPYVK